MPNCPACKQTLLATDGLGIPWRCPGCSQCYLGRYGEIELIASGATSDVFRGRDFLAANRIVAIKVSRSGGPEMARRFQRDVEASKLLRHESFVGAYEHGDEAGRLYLV